MDSLRLIYFRPRNPSWIWIRYVQHAFHKHHRNLLCRFERHYRSRQVPISPLVHCNGDNARLSPETPDTRSYTVALNTSLTRPTTRCHFQHPAKLSRLQKTHKPKYHEFCSAKNKPPQSCNKELSLLCYQRIVSQFISCAIKSIVFGKITNSHKTRYIPNNMCLWVYVYLPNSFTQARRDRTSVF